MNNFDQNAFDDALGREAGAVGNKLGQDRNNRRLGGNQTQRKDERTEEHRMNDKAIVTQGQALQRVGWDNKGEAIKAVQVAYSAGKGKLTPPQQMAVAMVAWNMGLDPSPGVGHIYAYDDYQGFHIQIGYQGWIFKAQQHFQFVYKVRSMNDQERAEHGLETGDIGAICELYEREKAALWREIGLEPAPIIGSATWKKKHHISKKTNEWVEDNVPNGRSPLWVAEKRATKDAISHLGLGFGVMQIKEVEGAKYDPDEGAYIMPNDSNKEEVIEGTFEATLEPAQESEEEPQAKTKKPRAKRYSAKMLIERLRQADVNDESLRISTVQIKALSIALSDYAMNTDQDNEIVLRYLLEQARVDSDENGHYSRKKLWEPQADWFIEWLRGDPDTVRAEIENLRQYVNTQAQENG